MAFNAKNLHYESNEPSFLRKLKSQYSGNGSGRHERPIARPTKPKDDDEDDEPTYVDEDNQDTLTKAQYEAMLKSNEETVTADPKVEGGSSLSEPNAAAPSDGGAEKQTADVEAVATPPKKELVAIIGVPNKRKAVKVIGNDVDKSAVAENSKSKGSNGTKIQQKRKKVKLSFDDET